MDGHDDEDPKAADDLAMDGALFEVPAERQRLGRYVVLGTLGKGGMGTVLAAFDRTLDRKVAVKVLREELDDKYTARLLREAQAMARLSHPNVVQVYEADVVGGQAFVAMELVEGQTLREWMRQEPRPDWRACVKAFSQVGQGLAAAHAEGLVHRDFKPDNAIIDHEGRARVLDFGLARRTEVDADLQGGLVPTHEGQLVTVRGGPLDSRTEEDRAFSLAVPERPSGSNLRTRGEDGPALDQALTRTGAVLGTPAYMPPEQMMGEEADAGSDQFSFCTALYEAVYGERPFEGTSMMALMVSITSGAMRPAPKGTRAPARLRTILQRGLALEPVQRWPSMEALLAALRQLVAPRTRRGVALGLVVGLVGLGGLVALPQYLAMQERCTGARAQLDGTWDDARRWQVQDAILGTGLSYAEDTWARVESRLDAYAQAWVGKHTEVCEATSVRGEQAEEAMELRMSCLRDRKVTLDAAVMVLADADDTVVEKAVSLVEVLPSIDRCDDVERLQKRRQRVPPPEDPQIAQQVEALHEQLAGIEAELAAGRPMDALERVEFVVEQAEALDYGPLRAEALIQRGIARHRTDGFVEAERDLGQAFALAAEHGHDAVAAEASSELVWVVGDLQERHEEGLGLGKTALVLALGPEVEPTVEAEALGNVGRVLVIQGKLEEALGHHERALTILERELGGSHITVASTLGNIGKVLLARGELSESLAHHRRALAIFERALGDNHTSVASSLGSIAVVLQKQDELSEALRHNQRALTIFERALGENHSSVSATLLNLGNVRYQQGELSEALRHYRRALSIKEQVLGESHSSIASTLVNIGNVLRDQGKLEAALSQYRRALDIEERVLGQGHATVAITLGSIGNVRYQQGELLEALSHYRRALVIKEQALGEDHPSVAITLGSIGTVLIQQGELSEASSQYRRALDIEERALGKNHTFLAFPLVGLAEVALAERDLDAARTHAERAVSIREAGSVLPALLAEARFVLARSLWDERGDRERARALAQQARDALVAAQESGHADVGLTEIDTWLAEHRAR